MSLVLEPKTDNALEIAKSIESHSSYERQQNEVDSLQEKSAGVARAEEIANVSNIYERSILFFGIVLIAFVQALGSATHTTMLYAATNSMGSAALQASVQVISSIVAAAAMPTGARLSDVFGRIELFTLAILFYVLGNIVCAAASDLVTISGGQVLYQLGFALLQIMMELVIADFTTVRSRPTFGLLPDYPYIITTWAGGNVVSAIIGQNNEHMMNMWRWGFGMWCIIMPVASLPLICTLGWLQIKASKQGLLKYHRTAFQSRKSMSHFCRSLFWRLDIPGTFLVLAVFILILYPLTLAGGYSSQWKTAKIIAPLVVGFCTIPFLVVYELWAPHPLIPFKAMRSRHILVPLGIGFLLDFIWMLQSDYLYYMLQVTFNFGVTGATRISSLLSFCSVLMQILVCAIIYLTRRVKIYMVLGSCIMIGAYGMLIKYRGGLDDRAGIVGSQVLLGISFGFFTFPALTVIQAFVDHENIGVMTGLFLAVCNIGMAFGNSVSGAVYTQILPKKLIEYLPTSDPQVFAAAYGNPLTLIRKYPIGTPVREGMILAYRAVQHTMSIVGICLVAVMIVLCCIMPNPILLDKRSLVEDDENFSLNDSGDFLARLANKMSLPATERMQSEHPTLLQRLKEEFW